MTLDLYAVRPGIRQQDPSQFAQLLFCTRFQSSLIEIEQNVRETHDQSASFSTRLQDFRYRDQEPLLRGISVLPSPFRFQTSMLSLDSREVFIRFGAFGFGLSLIHSLARLGELILGSEQ